MRNAATIASLLTLLSMSALPLVGCAPTDDVADESFGASDAPIVPGSPEADAVLAVVNDAAVDMEVLDVDVALDKRAATNIVAHRNGQDGVVLTIDDDLFDDLAELDRISYVGPSALDKLLAYAKANGYYQGGETPTEAERDYAMLAFVSDSAVDIPLLDDTVGLDKRAANNIVAFRDGVDAVAGTRDDRVFMSVAQLDDISYVGSGALAKLRGYAVDNGYLAQLPEGSRDVVFSPQAYHNSHNVRVAQVIDAAHHSLDIAMYSFSDERIFDAIEAAALRGVAVRFVFETASDDRSKSGTELDNSRSARLENMGVNVRWVNKIMHHKMMIVDGPRDDAATAASATLVTGSGNWSFGGATKYDENTLFLTGQPELTLRMQAEFNLMWEHSHDFAYVTMPHTLSSLQLDNQNIVDEDATHAYFTSDNFSVSGDTFRIVSGNNTVSDVLVDAIAHATDSIHIASGHMRSRPVAEALIAKRQQDPNIEIRVLLDGQEYISAWYQGEQLDDRDDCLAAAGTSASKIRQCNDKGFLYGYTLGQSGIDVHYKYYAYRWHYSYALQMHHKLMIIDGDELWTGSYNLSDNAEHNTFENMLVLRGLPFAEIIAQYQDNFEALWEMERDSSSYDDLVDTVNNDSTIPLVFAPMSLNWDEVTALKQAIRDNCADINTTPFRTEPNKHASCAR
jgi:phosphatidylserine/phosphatidylglycerophosphate/cardiolipin synthase-like enzyme